MVSRDHTPLGPTDAFFSESMRREAMTGMRIVFALGIHVGVDVSCLKATRHQGEWGAYIPGRS